MIPGQHLHASGLGLATVAFLFDVICGQRNALLEEWLH